MDKQELIEAIDNLEVKNMSYYNGDMNTSPREHYYINKYQVFSLIEKLDDIPDGYEVLSDDWIEEHKCRDKTIMLPTNPPKYVEFVKVSDLQNLLIPKKDNSIISLTNTPEHLEINKESYLHVTDTDVATTQEKVTEQQDWKTLLKFYPWKSTFNSKVSLEDNCYKGKVKIPQFVADWIEKCKGNNSPMTYLMSYIVIKNNEPHELNLWLFVSGSYDNIEKMARAWLDGYEVEQEQLYTVTLANGKQLCRIDDDVIDFNGQCCDEEFVDNYKLTRSEIESVDPVLMQIAKEVSK